MSGIPSYRTAQNWRSTPGACGARVDRRGFVDGAVNSVQPMRATSADQIGTSPIERARRLADLIVAHRLEGDELRRLPETLVTALVDAGLSPDEIEW